MVLQHRWACSWPWVATPADDSPSSQRRQPAVVIKRRQQRPWVDLRKLLDRATGVPAGAVQEQAQVWLPSPPNVPKPRAVHNAASLAYIGDAIYEVYVRRHFLMPPQSIDSFNKRVMALVCCEAQDAMLRQLLKGTFLTEEERDVVRWGKNIETGQRRASRRAGAAIYSSASALETLIGYLYLTNQQRLEELMMKVGFGDNSSSLLVGFGLHATVDGSQHSKTPGD